MVKAAAISEPQSKAQQTELGLIPYGWAVLPLSEFVTALDAGVSVNSDEKIASGEGVQCVLKTSCVLDGHFFPDEAKPIIRRELGRARTNPKRDSIIISRMNTPALVGECGYVPSDYGNLYLPDRLWITRHNRLFPHCVQWLAYVLSAPAINRALKESASGTSGSMKNLPKTALLAVKVPTPPKEEQEAIASALADADALVQALEHLIAKKRAIKQGAMQGLLSGRVRLPGYSDPWQRKPLGELCEVLNGLTYSPTDVRESGLLVLRSSNIQEERLSFEDNVFVQMTVPERSLVRSGDILVCVRNGSRELIGKCALIDDRCAGMAFGAFMAVLRTPLSGFILQQFRADPMKKQIAEHLGATINQITNKSLRSFLVPFPPTNREAEHVAKVLSEMDQELEGLIVQLNKSRLLKQAMMQSLLTGQVRLA